MRLTWFAANGQVEERENENQDNQRGQRVDHSAPMGSAGQPSEPREGEAKGSGSMFGDHDGLPNFLMKAPWMPAVRLFDARVGRPRRTLQRPTAELAENSPF